MYQTGNYLQSELAKKYHVDQTLISAIVRNKIWKKEDEKKMKKEDEKIK